MNGTHKRWIAAGISSVLLAGVAWWWWRGDGELERLQALRGQMEDSALSDEQRRELWQQFREGMRALPEADRERLFAGGFRGRMNQNLDEFFALEPKQRIAYLDRQINEMEKRRRQSGGRAGQGPPGGGFGPPGGGQNRSPAEREQARKRRLD